jgi:hypothetical protein
MIIEITQPDKDGNFLTLVRPEERVYNGKILKVPKGFRYDGASVPWLFRRIFPQIEPKTRKAVLFHDYGYKVQPLGWTRKEFDLIFYYQMIKDGKNRVLALLGYWAVRCFGWIPWRNNRRAKKS